MVKSNHHSSTKKLEKFKVSNFKNSRHSRMLALVAMLMVAALGTWTLLKTFAANDSMSLVPASSSVSLSSNFTVVIHENSGTDAINAVEADLNYDQTKLQFVSIDTTTSAFDLSAASSGGSGSVTIARAKSGTTLTGDQIIASVTFKGIGTGTSSVTFASSSAIVLASTATNVLSITNPGTYTVNDVTAPSVPSGLTVGTRTVSSIAFSWTASTDNVAVAGYKVYRNGVLINGNVATTNYTDTGLTPNTSYTYTVSAFDAAGNVSNQSTALVTSTLPDTTAPSVPSGLTAGTKTVTSISFSWTASTDNVAVVGYNIYRGGTKIGTSSTTSFTNTGLTPNTSYSYTVSAYDAVPNTSSQSTALVTSTLADTQAPTVPGGLSSPSQTTNSITLNWTTSTDNVAVIGYNVFRNGSKVGTSAINSYTDAGLVQGTSYTYTISAYDALPKT